MSEEKSDDFPVRVAVASGNPVKILAVAEAFTQMGKDYKVYISKENLSGKYLQTLNRLIEQGKLPAGIEYADGSSEALAEAHLHDPKAIVVVGVNVPSGIDEQPYDPVISKPGHPLHYMQTGRNRDSKQLDTLRGAATRAFNARAFDHPVPFGKYGVNFYVNAVESGIFKEGGRYIDRGIVVVESNDSDKAPHTHVYFTKGVEFPREFVKMSQKALWGKTASAFMEEAGVIRDNKDPHQDIAGIPRTALLGEKILEAFTDQLEGKIDLTKNTYKEDMEILPAQKAFLDKLRAWRKTQEKPLAILAAAIGEKIGLGRGHERGEA